MNVEKGPNNNGEEDKEEVGYRRESELEILDNNTPLSGEPELEGEGEFDRGDNL